MNKSIVKVDVVTFNDLLKLVISIPDFQRSYVWTNKNLEKLISDFEELKDNKQNQYYMGTLLLYDMNSKYEIIDGQQRITTLAILYKILYKFPQNFKLEFSSQESMNNIIKANEYFEKNNERITAIKSIFDKLIFTLITTTSQDEAFTFFDTQNSRGVKLKAIDLLKSHHLRAINDIYKQRISAEKWVEIETKQKSLLGRKNSDFIDELFKYVLYRARIWRGHHKKIVNIESSERIQNEKIKDEFEKGIYTTNILLYPHPKNMFLHSLDVDENNEYILDFRWKQFKYNAKDLPFSLRQPISKGLEFFLYVEKYSQITEHLIGINENLQEYKEFYNNVIMKPSFSIYLREFFILCSVCYYDKFENNKLIEFSLWLEYILGAVRMNQSMIVERTVTKTIRDLPYNIIDVILAAYNPEEVITYLKSIKIIGNENILKIYSKNISSRKKILIEEKVKEVEATSIEYRYVKSILDFYNQNILENILEVTLERKSTWIEEKVKYVKKL